MMRSGDDRPAVLAERGGDGLLIGDGRALRSGERRGVLLIELALIGEYLSAEAIVLLPDGVGVLKAVDAVKVDEVETLHELLEAVPVLDHPFELVTLVVGQHVEPSPF